MTDTRRIVGLISIIAAFTAAAVILSRQHVGASLLTALGGALTGLAALYLKATSRPDARAGDDDEPQHPAPA